MYKVDEQAVCILQEYFLFTDCDEKVMFYTCLSVILSTGGVYTSMHLGRGVNRRYEWELCGWGCGHGVWTGGFVDGEV